MTDEPETGSARGAVLPGLLLTALPIAALWVFSRTLFDRREAWDASMALYVAVLAGSGAAAGAACRTRGGVAAWGAFLGQCAGLLASMAGEDGTGAGLWPLGLGIAALLAQAARLGAWAGRRLRGADGEPDLR